MRRSRGTDMKGFVRKLEPKHAPEEMRVSLDFIQDPF